jgi:lipopolysaccharide export LptBFGC system permease protein LptF
MDYNTDLIQERIKNVGKLIVTEGHFSQVMTYKDQQKYLMDLISFEKKAIIIINADVTISYDLRQMKYAIDDKNKVITILTIPKEEVKISPDIQFYNVEQSTMNAFTGDDYNKINKKVKADLANKVAKSKLKANAKNRLISELSTILVLTHSMGWKLQYEDQIISTDKEIDTKIKL